MLHFNNKRRTPSKVVSIPVRFIGSERNRNDSATEIQMVARGYLVRKSVKKMLKMKVELEELDNKVNNEETVKMMKKEQKERIRIGETIMNMLLRLDSVRVFHCCGLRELRKSLIKKAIVLQELVHQIQMVSPTDDVEENCSEMEEVGCEEEIEGGDEDEKKMEEEESVGSSLMEQEIMEDSVDVKEDEGRNVIGCDEEEYENREILRRMMDDSEKMMHLMTQLFERNEKQASLLTSLTQRVEQLERAFTCDKLKKKNKRRRHVDAKHRYNGFM